MPVIVCEDSSALNRAEQRLFPAGLRRSAQTAIHQHQSVVRLQIFGIHAQRIQQSLLGIRVLALQKQMRPIWFNTTRSRGYMAAVVRSDCSAPS